MPHAPLPIRDGLNPSRLIVPGRRGDNPVSALDLLTAAIYGQRHRHPDDDHEAIAQRFRDGLVVDARGRKLAGDEKLKPGALVWFYRIPAPEPVIAGEMPIIYADDDLVVVDKPPFLATIPKGRHITETAVVRLRRELSNPDLVPAHRLDRVTSGLLIFTARPEMRQQYQTLFANPGMVTKRYHALTRPGGEGVGGVELSGRAGLSGRVGLSELPQTPWQISTRQKKIPGELQAFTISGEPNAHTVVEDVQPVAFPCDGEGGEVSDASDGVVSTDTKIAWRWILRPLTGRTHQLRLHLLEQGTPIIGDQVYPDILPTEAEDPSKPLHLTCAYMGFHDPFTGAWREFHSRRDVADPLTVSS